MVGETSELVAREIDRLVQAAASSGECLLLSAAVEDVRRAIADRHTGEHYVACEILIAATAAMVAVKVDSEAVRLDGQAGEAT